jgi:hypothetical protein
VQVFVLCPCRGTYALGIRYQASPLPTAVAVIGTTPYWVSNHDCYCRGNCFLVAVSRDYRHGLRARSLLLPCLCSPRRCSGFDDLSFGIWGGTILSRRRRVLLTDGGFWALRWSLRHRPIRSPGS